MYSFSGEGKPSLILTSKYSESSPILTKDIQDSGTRLMGCRTILTGKLFDNFYTKSGPAMLRVRETLAFFVIICCCCEEWLP